MPQSMSRVIARGRISLRMFWLNRITFGRQVPDGLALVEPLPQRVGQRRQVEEEVLGLDELRRLAVDLASAG